MNNKEISINGDVWLCGDVHGRHDKLFHAIKTEDVRDAHIIILGDVGIGFYAEDPPYLPREYRNLQKRASERNLQLWLIRGNHDNPVFWEGALKEQAEKDYPNIHLLQQGFVTINGDIHYIFPGGVSIDRFKRREGQSYWKDEVVKFASSELSETLPVVKAVLGHTGPRPHGLSNDLLDYYVMMDSGLHELLSDEYKVVSDVIQALNPQYFIYGHYHVSWREQHMHPKCIALNICELMKLDYNDE